MILIIAMNDSICFKRIQKTIITIIIYISMIVLMIRFMINDSDSLFRSYDCVSMMTLYVLCDNIYNCL